MPTIGASVTAEIKRAFDVAADSRSLTASALANNLILDFLRSQEQQFDSPTLLQSHPFTSAFAQPGPRSEQVFVRLHPYYFEELTRLAQSRNWARSTYLANLVRVHIDRRPVLSNDELQAVRQAARLLADLGRNINQVAKKLNASTEHTHLAMGLNLADIGEAVRLEASAAKALVKANLHAWGVSDVQ